MKSWVYKQPVLQDVCVLHGSRMTELNHQLAQCKVMIISRKTMLCFQSGAAGDPESKEIICAASVLTMACPAHPSKDYSPSFAWHCQAINMINTGIINLVNLEVMSL